VLTRRGVAGVVVALLAVSACNGSSSVQPNPALMPTLPPTQWTEADATACSQEVATMSHQYDPDGFRFDRFSSSVSDRQLDLQYIDDMSALVQGAARQYPKYFGAYYPPIIAKLNDLRATLAKTMTADQFWSPSFTALDFLKGLLYGGGGPSTIEFATLGEPCGEIRSWIDAHVVQ
jgi:hypothetical protein